MNACKPCRAQLSGVPLAAGVPTIYSWLAVFTSTSIFALLPNQHLHTLARTPGLHAHTVLLSVWSFHVSSFFHIALQGLIVWQSSSFVNSRERIHHAAIHFEKNNSTDMITDHHADTPAMDDNGTVTASANTFSLCKNSTIHGWYYSAVFWQKTLLGQAWTMPLCRVSWAQICGGKTRQVLLQGYLPIPVGCWQLGGVTATQEGKKRWEIKYLITKKLCKYTL